MFSPVGVEAFIASGWRRADVVKRGSALTNCRPRDESPPVFLHWLICVADQLLIPSMEAGNFLQEGDYISIERSPAKAILQISLRQPAQGFILGKGAKYRFVGAVRHLQSVAVESVKFLTESRAD